MLNDATWAALAPKVGGTNLGRLNQYRINNIDRKTGRMERRNSPADTASNKKREASAGEVTRRTHSIIRGTLASTDPLDVDISSAIQPHLLLRGMERLHPFCRPIGLTLSTETEPLHEMRTLITVMGVARYHWVGNKRAAGVAKLK